MYGGWHNMYCYERNSYACRFMGASQYSKTGKSYCAQCDAGTFTISHDPPLVSHAVPELILLMIPRFARSVGLALGSLVKTFLPVVTEARGIIQKCMVLKIQASASYVVQASIRQWRTLHVVTAWPESGNPE